MFKLIRYLLAALLAVLLAGTILVLADWVFASGHDMAPRLADRWALVFLWLGRLAAAIAGSAAIVTSLRARDGLGLLRRVTGLLVWLAAILLTGAAVLTVLAVLTPSRTPSRDMPAGDLVPVGFVFTTLSLGVLVLGLAVLLLVVWWTWRRVAAQRQQREQPT